MLRSRPWLWMLFAVAVLGACKPPKFVHPLLPLTQAKADERLAGTWRGRTVEGSDPVVLYVVQRAGALVDVVLLGDDGEKGAVNLHFEGFPTSLDGRTYLNLRRKTFAAEYGEKPQVDKLYLLVRYELAADGSLTLSLLEEEPLKKAVKTGALAGKLEGDDVTVTAESGQLAAFFRKGDPAKLFAAFARLEKLAPPAVREPRPSAPPRAK